MNMRMLAAGWSLLAAGMACTGLILSTDGTDWLLAVQLPMQFVGVGLILRAVTR